MRVEVSVFEEVGDYLESKGEELKLGAPEWREVDAAFKRLSADPWCGSAPLIAVGSDYLLAHAVGDCLHLELFYDAEEQDDDVVLVTVRSAFLGYKM